MAVVNKIAPVTMVVALSIIVFFIFVGLGDYRHKPMTHDGPGSRFEIKLAPLESPKHIFKRRDPYSMPIPRPFFVYGQKETFKSTMFSIFKYANTALDDVLWQDTNDPQCSLQHNGTFVYTQAQLDVFTKFVKKGYRLKYFVDNMPIVSEYGDDLWFGVDIGFISESGELYLYTHQDIHIVVDLYGRVMRAVFVPRHTDPTAPCGNEYAQPTRTDSEVVWSYRVFVDTVNTLYEDRYDWYDTKLHGQHPKIEKVALIWCGVAAFIVFLLVAYRVYRIANRQYGLDGIFLQLSSTLAGDPAEQEMESLDRDSSEDIEIDLEYALVEEQARRRTTTTTYVRNDVDVTESDCGEPIQAYLKKSASIILGAPVHGTVWLAAFNGTGMHLLFVTLLGLAMSAFVQHTWENAWQTVIVLMVPTTGWIAGFQANKTMRLYRTKNLICSMIIAVLIMPSVLFFIFFLVNSIEMMHHDSAIIAAMVFFCLLLWVVDMVSMASGAWLASKFDVPALPEAPVIRFLRPVTHNRCDWIVPFVLTTVVYAVIVGISVLYVTMLIVQSIWANHVNIMIGVIIGFILFWVLITIGTSILIADYRIIVHRNPFWHWQTFFTGGGPAVVAFLVGIFYAFTVNRNANIFAQFLIYSIVTFVSAMIFIVLGSVSVISVDTFFRRFVYNKRNLMLK